MCREVKVKDPDDQTGGKSESKSDITADLQKFAMIVVQIGWNDIDVQGVQGSTVLKDYEDMFEEYKKHDRLINIVISTPFVCLNNSKYATLLRKVSNSLELLCDQYGFTFVDNEPAFERKSGQIRFCRRCSHRPQRN